MNNVHHITHPLVQHKLTLMRRKDASTSTFRTLLNELSTLMAYEVTRDMPLQSIEVETPLETMTSQVIDGKKLVFVSILRAGNGILEGMLSVVPGARVGHVGLYRDPKTMVAYEVTRDMPMQEIEVETPLETMVSKVIDGKKLVFVSILRAGNGILEGMLNIVPGARVGHVGLYRDPKTMVAVEYYFKMPKDMQERDIVVVDPMLATGNSAIAAVERLKELSPKSIKFVCLLTCPQGIAAFHKAHPDVPIYTAAVDRQLNDHGYILPGLGDAGDRIFGTQ